METAMFDECINYITRKLSDRDIDRRMDMVVDTLFAKLVKRMYPFIITSALTVVIIVLLMLYMCFNVKQIKK